VHWIRISEDDLLHLLDCERCQKQVQQAIDGDENSTPAGFGDALMRYFEGENYAN